MQEEGDTVTTVIESQGDVEEVTQTTVTVEHKNTGDVLDSDNGIVATSKDGNANIDWSGAGAIYSHSSCTDAASGFPATGTDGRTKNCGHARYASTLTTWRQYVDLNSFDITDGGEVNYEFLFAFPNSMYNNSGQTAYVQTKGYNENTLQWETGLVPIDKTTFTQNPYNYTNNTNWVNTVTGTYDFANQLDKIYIEIGMTGEAYWDEFQYNVAYNYITTAVETWMQVVEQQQDLDTTMDLIDNYEVVDTFEQEVVDTTMEDFTDMDVGMGGDPEVNVEVDMPDMPDMDGGSIMTDMPDTTTAVAEMFEDLEIGVPVMDMDEVVAEVETAMTEINVSTEEPTGETTAPIEDVTEPTEVVEVETPTEEQSVDEQPSEADTVEVEPEATEAEPVEEVVEAEPESESQETEEVVEDKPEEKKEVAQNDIKEKEPVQKTAKQEKQEKKQEQKQAKAKEILSNFTDPYSNVAQMTTLALVNALGPDIKTYQVSVQVQPVWYEEEEIYTDAIIPDPLGNYFGVRDSLTYNNLIDMQYD